MSVDFENRRLQYLGQVEEWSAPHAEMLLVVAHELARVDLTKQSTQAKGQ